MQRNLVENDVEKRSKQIDDTVKFKQNSMKMK